MAMLGARRELVDYLKTSHQSLINQMSKGYSSSLTSKLLATRKSETYRGRKRINFKLFKKKEANNSRTHLYFKLSKQTLVR
jgi:hypothetical protein